MRHLTDEMESIQWECTRCETRELELKRRNWDCRLLRMCLFLLLLGDRLLTLPDFSVLLYEVADHSVEHSFEALPAPIHPAKLFSILTSRWERSFIHNIMH